MSEIRCLCLQRKGIWTHTRKHFDTQIYPIDPLLITKITSCDEDEKRALFAWYSAKDSPMRKIFPEYPNGGEAL
jgi:hypothetical protein